MLRALYAVPLEAARSRGLTERIGGPSTLTGELADHVEHLAGRGVFDPDALVDAVGRVEDRERFETYRRLWAVFWLLMLLPSNRGFDRNPAGTTEAQAARLLRLLGRGS